MGGGREFEKLESPPRQYNSRLVYPGGFVYFPFCFRPAFFLASFVRPSTPPRFHNVLRHFFEGHNGGSSTSGIHRWPQTSQTATFIVVQPMAVSYFMTRGQKSLLFWDIAVYNMTIGHNEN